MQAAENSIPVKQWVSFLGREYLESFVTDGGASIKFTASSEEQIPILASNLADQATKLNCLFIGVNAVETRVHMPQDIFFAISRQVDWQLLARKMIVQLAERASGSKYKTTDVDPSAPGNIYSAIGEANGLETSSMIQALRVEVQDKITKNRRMARDFRVAMSRLCQFEEVEPEDYGGQLLLDWLTGANAAISNVRHLSIRTAINRTTARHFMESALYWIQYAGYSGTVIFLDNSRVTLPRRPDDGSRFYTRPMVMDHYELLRELIDSSDRLAGTLVVVASNHDFLDEDTKSRGFGIYEALMTRVMNDVRDKNQVNPMASLVRIS